MSVNYTLSDSCPSQNHLCVANSNLDPADNFREDELNYEIDRCIYTIFCIVLLSFTGLLCHYTNKKNVFYKNFTIISLLIIALIFLIDGLTMGKETCLFPRWCHEGSDDQIIPTFYFYQMNECPRYNSWLADDYRLAKNYECESSEYGCCEVQEIGCDEFYHEGYTYSRYVSLMDHYDGRWQLSVDKQDEEGSNCPTIEEIIYQVSTNEKNNHPLLYLPYTITAMIIMCLFIVCNICMEKEEYEKTESDDVEKNTTSQKGLRLSVIPSGKKVETKKESITMKESV
mgnify:CR=1 FL=1